MTPRSKLVAGHDGLNLPPSRHVAVSHIPPRNRPPPRPPPPPPPLRPQPLPRGPAPPHGNSPRGGGERLRPGTQWPFGGGGENPGWGGPRPPEGPVGRDTGDAGLPRGLARDAGGGECGEGANPGDMTALWRELSSKFVAVSATMPERRSMVASPSGAHRMSCRTGLAPAGSADPPDPPCW